MTVPAVFSPGGTVGRIRGYLLPFYNIGKTALALTSSIKSGIPKARAMKVLKNAAFKGQGTLAPEFRQFMGAFSDRIEDEQKRKLLTGWTDLAAPPKGDISDKLLRSVKSVRQDIGTMFYKTMRYDLNRANVKSMIDTTLTEHGISLRGPGQLQGMLMSSKSRVLDTMIHGNSARDLLSGPSLSANLAILSIPTLTSTVSTATVVRALKNKATSRYKGYVGDVF